MPSLQLIVAPPPTPNGDLHVGHMSGPYLAAISIERRQSCSRVAGPCIRLAAMITNRM